MPGRRTLVRARIHALRDGLTWCLPRARKAEIDLARARIRPARGHDLRSRVELHALGAVHVQVPEEAVLPATEAVGGDRHGDGHVHADHPGVDLELELP